MSNQKNGQKLLQKYLSGSCTEYERKIVEEWYAQITLHESLPYEYVDYERIKNQRLNQIFGEQSVLSLRHRIKPWIPYAVAIVICVVLVFWNLSSHREIPKTQIAEFIKPGGNKATLTLADGSTILLSEAQSGVMSGEELRYKDGTLINLNLVVDKGERSESREFTLSTPRGGNYNIRLADGTEVWLNAGSKLIYPSIFNGSDRVVKLQGEAYFKVAKQNGSNGDRIPFKVITENQIVDVVGTEFNVNAYETIEKTTLVEGKVNLKAKINLTPVLLKPGNQGVISGESVKVEPIDLFAVTAWRKGRFNFDNQPFSEIMDEFSRWYDFDVVYEDPIPKVQFVGGAHRTQNISTVLQMLESANIIYRMEKKNGRYILFIKHRKEAEIK